MIEETHINELSMMEWNPWSLWVGFNYYKRWGNIW